MPHAMTSYMRRKFFGCGLPMPERFSKEKDGLQASPIVSEQYLYEQGRHRVLYDGNYKYFTYEKKRNSELYDIKNDPHEKEDLAALFPDTALQMKNRLERWQEEHQPQVKSETPEASPSSELIQGLKALGYIE
jgi:arylsulfatase A-like enzyme